MMPATAIPQDPMARLAPRFRARVAQTWRNAAKDLLDPYRPELHYMRGPGPKWRAKQAGTADAARSAIA
jgi:hypothetical protein